MSIQIDIAYLFKGEVNSDGPAYDLVNTIEHRISAMISEMQSTIDEKGSTIGIEEISVSYSDGEIDDNPD